MEAPKHTPGPWYRSGCRRKIDGMDNHGVVATVDGEEIIIASVWYNPSTHEGFHDARLITAAPDMHDALRNGLAGIDAAYAACPVNSSSRSVDVCPKCGATDRQNCGLWVRAAGLMEEAARAALAKAEGHEAPRPPEAAQVLASSPGCPPKSESDHA